MAQSLNQIQLIGNLGRDAETKFTPSGSAATKFSVATTRSWKDKQTDEWKEQTTWINVVLWGKENLAQHLTKGKQVFVQGRLDNRSYEKDGETKYITEVVADTVMLLGGKSANSSDDDAAAAYSHRSAAAGASSKSVGKGYQGPSNRHVPARTDQSGEPFDANAQITDDDIPFS